MWFITLVLKNVLQRKLRSALTCTGIAFAVCSLVTMVGMAEGFENAFIRTYARRGVDVPTNPPETLARSAVMQRYLELFNAQRCRLRSRRGVARRIGATGPGRPAR